VSVEITTGVRSWAFAISAMACLATPAAAGTDGPVHGFAIQGPPKYPADFEHFEYVNPDAPKGGTLVLNAFSQTFDSLNPFILRGTPAAGLAYLHQHDVLPGAGTPISESLMVGSLDEPFASYGLIAETIEVPEDRSYVRFQLRPEARFQDGRQITVDDVIFSFVTLMEKGQPLFRAYYDDVDRVEQTGDREVTFFFTVSGNTELPLIIGQMPILSEAYWADKDFEEPGLVGPLGSGPYRISSFEPGRYVEYERVTDYWGKDLPVNVGRHNFDRIRYDYYRDDTVAFEAFLAGEYDLRYENSARNWAIGYDGEALNEGRIVKEALPDQTPSGMQGFVYNTRLPIFSDKRVRRALAYAFDFPWTNRTIFYSEYLRSRSYFQNSDMAATGLPEGRELELLEPFRDSLPEEVFTEEYNPPTTDGSGNVRENLLVARGLLEEAGWTQTQEGLVNADGEVFEFEILLRSASFERIVGPFLQNLERLGVKASMRTVDTSQWVNRIQAYDFDMMIFPFAQSTSPGNEQREFWSTEAADEPGTRNFAGVKDPVVDELIEGLIQAGTRAELVAHTRALDRVLQWGYYLIPQWYADTHRLAYWNKFGHPDITPLRGVPSSAWWIDPVKAAALTQTSQESDSTARADSDTEANAQTDQDDTNLILIIAVAGVALLLWSSIRRRNRK